MVFSRRFVSRRYHAVLWPARENVCTIDVISKTTELIAQMYAKLNEGYEVVYAKRRTRKGDAIKRMITKLAILINRLSMCNPPQYGDFRIIRAGHRGVAALE